MTCEASAYDIAAVRKQWVGKQIAVSSGRYPVEHEPIRRHCHMVRDTNPLFLDPEAAEQGPYGAVIVPPAMLLGHFSNPGHWPRRSDSANLPADRPAFSFGVPTPGDRGINMGTSWDFLMPVRVGDQLTEERSIDDVFLKPIRLDPMAVWIVSQTTLRNQRGDVVAIGMNTVLIHRSPSQIAADEAREAPDT